LNYVIINENFYYLRGVAMNKSNKITDSEWKVMEILWSNGQLKASKIIEELQPNTKWSDNTIRTLINRLVDKGILGVKKERVNEYYPLISREKSMENETNKFIEKVYKGSAGLLISNFIKSNKLTAEDLKVIKKTLDKDENL